jgi:hypothetical protein
MKSRNRQLVVLYYAGCPCQLNALGIDRLSDQFPDVPLRG